jgi:hypothetical protein
VITNRRDHRAISTLGWVDHGALWVFDVGSSVPQHMPLSDARYLVLSRGQDDHFAAVHHWDGSRVRITVHGFDSPNLELGRIDVAGWTGSISGDESDWRTVPGGYVAYLNGSATGAAGYFLIRFVGADVQVSRLDWFAADTYDLQYQGIASVTEVPETHETLFGIQRSSDLVLCSPDGSVVTRTVRLPGNLGNPKPLMSTRDGSVWVTNYDTVVRLDRRTWDVVAFAQLSPSTMFVGNLWLSADERYLVVARPGSGDVVIVDAQSLGVLKSVNLGRQPLVASVLDGSIVVGRDWKTGETLLDVLDPSL